MDHDAVFLCINMCVSCDANPRVCVCLLSAFRSKMYAYSGEGVSGKRAKGVNKAVLKSSINMDDYKECLLKQESSSRDMPTLRSDHHLIFGQSTRKTALSCFDSKRYILEGGIATLAYGHCRI